jgi:hypothetical protein
MIAGVVVGVCLIAVSDATAAALQTWGDPLTDSSNAGFGCETQPTLIDASGNYYPVASNQTDCPWFNTGGGTVPGDGVVVSVTIKSGPQPARVRFVVVRTLAQPGTGTECCIFAGESQVFQPTPNSVQTFPVNLPVERNTNTVTQIVTQDNIGVSAVAGTGTLPLHDNGRHKSRDRRWSRPSSASVRAPRRSSRAPAPGPRSPSRCRRRRTRRSPSRSRPPASDGARRASRRRVRSATRAAARAGARSGR